MTDNYKMDIALAVGPSVEDIETNYFTKYLEEVTGIDLVIDLLPATDAITKVNLMLSSGNMPGVIAGVSLPGSVVNEQAQAGNFVALDGYLETYGIGFYQVIERLGDDAETYLNFVTMSDGHIYSMHNVSGMTTNKFDMMTWVYEPWLIDLNIPEPKTLDDFYNMCVAFKTKDPNKNGKADEVPISLASSESNRLMSYIGNAFQYTDYNWRLKVDNGVVEFVANNDLYKQTLQYLNKMMNEGLIDPLVFTQSRAELKAIIAQEDLTIGVIPYASPSGYMNSTSEPMLSFKIIDALEGPNGFKATVNNGIRILHGYFVTKNCDRPAAAVRMIDYMYSDDGYPSFMYGEKGVDWDEPDQGATDVLGNPASVKIIQDVYGFPSQNKIWRNNTIGYIMDQRYLARQNDTKNIREYEARKYIGSLLLEPSSPDEFVPSSLKYVSAEAEAQVTKLKTDLIGYVEEMSALFILGDLPFDQWDTYVNELKVIGVDEYVRLIQESYDKMLGK